MGQPIRVGSTLALAGQPLLASSYQAALKEIAALMDADPELGTPEGAAWAFRPRA